MLAAMVLIAGRTVPAQPHPQTGGLRHQMIEAVQQRNEITLLDLIREPAGRQELLALSDNSVFEVGAAKMLAASLPQSPEVRKALRQTELSLLRQTDDESVVKELCLGLLVSEIREARDSSMALTAADALYDDIQKDLNDVIRLRGKEEVIQGEKLKTMLETADALTKAVLEIREKLFLNEYWLERMFQLISPRRRPKRLFREQHQRSKRHSPANLFGNYS